MSKIIRIGVLGCAKIAYRSMIPAICELGTHFKLAGVASRDVAKASVFSSQFLCRPYENYEQLIDAPDIDALYIPLPTGLHKKWIMRALNAGKHVYAEKSIALCVPDAIEMVDRARSKSLALMEGFMFQYHSQHQQVKKLVSAGAIGQIRHFYSSFGFPPLSIDDFRYDDSLGGGVLLDAAGYPLRAVHFLLGDEFKVQSAILHHDQVKGTQIYGAAFLTNSSGIGASLAFSFDSFYQCRYEILGQSGKLTAERAFTPSPDFSPTLILETSTGKQLILAEPDNHFVKAMLRFHLAIKSVEERSTLYSEILLQSNSLASIKKIGLLN